MHISFIQKHSYKVLFLLLINCTSPKENTKSDHKEIEYHFEANDTFLSPNNFTIIRSIINDTIFKDKGIFCDDTSSVCDIKLSFNKNVWRVWTGQQWTNLFDEWNKLNKIYFPFYNKTLLPKEPYILQNETLYAFNFRDLSLDFSTDNNEYLFSKKDGIVILKDEMTFYKRSDYKLDEIKVIMIDRYN